MFDNVVIADNLFGIDAAALTDWLTKNGTLTSVDLSSELFCLETQPLTRRIADTDVPAALIALVLANNKSLTRIELACEKRFAFLARDLLFHCERLLQICDMMTSTASKQSCRL